MNDANPHFKGLKVLVIDDSKTIRKTAETLLSKEGCQVFTAVDGFDALAKVADYTPDIVFVDIMMPRLDGYQTCALIKKNSRFHAMPVVMLSSKDGLFDRARGRMVADQRCRQLQPGRGVKLVAEIHRRERVEPQCAEG